MSKAQVTLFIILGIVILVIVSFVFYITQTAHEKKLEAEIEKPIADFIKSKTVNYYVMTCLDKASREALTLIGDQGGFIYKEQNGLIDWPIPYIEYQDKKVAYQIYSDLSDKLKPRNNLIHYPPYYPCFKRGPNSWIGSTCYKNYDYNQQQYFFGSSSEPTNKINPDLCKKKITTTGYVCSCSNPPDSLNCRYSIQAQLEDYIEKKVKECADFSNLKGYDISKGDVIANITFGNNDVFFKIDFPITIKVKDSEPIIKILEFSLPKQIRLKILHNLARELIKKDIDDITFDIMEDGQELANKYGDIEIKRDSNTYKNTSIIIIEDLESKIDGKNYVFMFARENRPPALDYMRFNSFTDSNSNTYDLYVIENQTLNFTPTAFDPDEHGITSPLIYDYLGWKNYSLKASKIYRTPSQHECTHLFSETNEKGRCADHRLTRADIGPHTLTIKPIDQGNLYDYQEIKILVDDIPEINLIRNNTFADIADNLASIEDPFILDATKTKDNFPEPVKLLFKWTHIKPDGTTAIIQAWNYNNIIYFPNQNPDIDYMDGLFNIVGTHKINLEVKNEQQTPLENMANNTPKITVSECLPHRSAHASYPFNDVNWDNYGYPGTTVADFQGNHACCKDDSTYENSNKVCYNLVDYGCLDQHFTDPNSEYYDPGRLRQQGINPSISTSGSSGNAHKDVYKRTLTRKCSGSRGNICGGAVSVYTIVWDHACPSNWHCVHTIYGPGPACERD